MKQFKLIEKGITPFTEETTSLPTNKWTLRLFQKPFIVMVLLLTCLELHAKDSIARNLHFNVEFHQLKKSSNYGLIKNGANIYFGYNCNNRSNN